MYCAAQLIEVDEAVQRIRDGASLDGRRIAAEEVLQRLSQEDGERRTIRNAALDPFRLAGASFSAPLVFESCQFIRNVVFDDCTFDALRIQDSQVDGALVVRRCRFDENFRLHATDVSHEVRMEGCRLQRPPRCTKVSFGARMYCAGNSALRYAETPERVTWYWSECQFQGPVYFESSGVAESLVFNECRFESGSLSEIKLDLRNEKIGCRFVKCLIAGRVLLMELTAQDSSEAPASTLFCDARFSTITGELNLRELNLASLALEDVIIPSGRLVMKREQLYEAVADAHWWRFWEWMPGDRCGILAREKRVLKRQDNPPFPQLPRQPPEGAAVGRWGDSPGPVAREYEELRNAYAGTPATDWEEDFCHYKCMDYRRRDAVARRLDASSLRTARRISVEIACGSALLYSLSWVAFALSSTFLSTVSFVCAMLLVVLLLPVAMACVFRKRFGTAVRLGWDWGVLKWTIGYGVYAHRVLVAAVGVILVYALAYGSCLHLAPGMGDIDNDGVSIIDDHPITVARRLVYFSGVTFSTLGYGDYSPSGWIQLVTITESLLGAVTIALVVVVFARKFIRR